METPIGKLAAKGIRISDILVVGLAVAVGALVVAFLGHKADAKEYNAAMTAALYEQTKAIKSLTRAQIITTCVMSMPARRREMEFSDSNSFCRRLADLSQ